MYNTMKIALSFVIINYLHCIIHVIASIAINIFIVRITCKYSDNTVIFHTIEITIITIAL